MGGRVVCTIDEDLYRFLSCSPEHDLSLSVQGWVIPKGPYSSLPRISSSLCNSYAKTEVTLRKLVSSCPIYTSTQTSCNISTGHTQNWSMIASLQPAQPFLLPPSLWSASVNLQIAVFSHWSVVKTQGHSFCNVYRVLSFFHFRWFLIFFGRLFPCNPSSPWTQPPCLYFPKTCMCHCTLFISSLLNLSIKQLLFYVFIFWCICVYLCGGQRRVPGFSFYYLLSYSFKTGPLTEPRARLVTNRSQESSYLCTTALGLQECMATSISLSRCWDLNAYSQSRFSNPLSKAFEILRFCCCCCFGLSWTL